MRLYNCKIIGTAGIFQQIEVIDFFPAICQFHVQLFGKRNCPESTQGVLSFQGLIVDTPPVPSGRIHIFCSGMSPRIEPVSVTEKEVFSRSALRMAYRHPLINIPLVKLTMRIKNVIPEEILESEIVFTVIRKPRDIDTPQVTLDKRPEFCRILTRELEVCLRIPEKRYPPTNFKSSEAV